MITFSKFGDHLIKLIPTNPITRGRKKFLIQLSFAK